MIELLKSLGKWAVRHESLIALSILMTAVVAVRRRIDIEAEWSEDGRVLFDVGVSDGKQLKGKDTDE